MSSKLEAARFVSGCMEARTHAHKLHLLTTSYSQHMALKCFYDGIGDLADAYAEAYMGLYGKFQTIPAAGVTFDLDPIKFIDQFMGVVEKMRTRADDSPTCAALIDDIAALTASTQYKLVVLK
jgi:hypothetical protein